jgi:HD superfamily phosphohydrolase
MFSIDVRRYNFYDNSFRMNTTKRIRTVLYGDQRLSAAELEVLHTPAMQRLYGLRQLGLTDRIFIDASHARIHHVVGVLHHVDKLMAAIEINLGRSKRPLKIGTKGSHKTLAATELIELAQKRKPVVRFIGLLHDLTHAPFGHTVEDEIRLVGTKHDEPARQADAFYRMLCQLFAWLWVEAKGPDLTQCPELKPFLSQSAEAATPDPQKAGELAARLFSDVSFIEATTCWRLTHGEIAELLAQLRCAMTALLHLEALHKSVLHSWDLPDGGEYEFQAAIRIALTGTSFEHLLTEFDFQPRRDAFMLDIVGNTVCADLLDYAKRDSHFAGLRLDYDPERIAENFTLVSHDASGYEFSHRQGDDGSDLRRSVPSGAADPFDGWCLRTAISLFSHKYRTDIPSELMNLLNVRFYLYERAIYHPTKCAAGSMLGTALQLLGWRGSAANTTPTLPPHLRFVGDDVFLHDICAALNFVLDWTKARTAEETIAEGSLVQLANLDRVHNGLVLALLRLRIGQTMAEARREFSASRLMLDRLTARRYFRPVWRALPSSTDARLQAGAEALAELFRQPDIRYEAERQIEIKADLPLGTVTIHCPSRTTARKIANVLLTKPGEGGEDEICKLKDIGSLDGPIFGEHQKAVKAVEQMYGSMWRLTVYVAPEHLGHYERIADACGQVVFQTVDLHGQFEDRPETLWHNDPNLQKELSMKLESSQTLSRSAGPTNIADLLGRVSDRLMQSGALTEIPPDLAGGANSAELEEKLCTTILDIMNSKVGVAPVVNATDRAERLLALLRTHSKKLKREHASEFIERYSPALVEIPPDAFEIVFGKMQSAIIQTGELDSRGQTVHRGYKFNEFCEVLDAQLKPYGAVPSPRGKKQKNPLFGE